MSLLIWTGVSTTILFLFVFVVYIATLIKVYNEKKFPQAITILLLLAISNLVNSIGPLLDYLLYNGENSNTMLIIFMAVSYTIYYTCFNVAHWLFAYEYFNLVRTIPYVFANKKIPQELLASNKRQYWFWLTLNIVFSLIFGLIASLAYLKFENKTANTFITVSFVVNYYIIGLLQIVSGVYLGHSIYKIREII